MKTTGQSFRVAEAKEQNIVGRMLAEARRSAGLSRAELSGALRSCGLEISPSGISKWEQGTRTPTAYHMMALCRVLRIGDPLEIYAPELNAAGRQKLAEYREDLVASGRYAPQRKPAAELRCIDIKLYDIGVSAGTGSFLDGGGCELLRVSEDAVPEGTDYALRVSGRSMEPVYRDGQIVWVRETESIRPGEVGIFALDGESFIKLYEEQMPDEAVREEYTDSYGRVRMQPVLVSYNSEFAPRAVLPTSYFKVLGRVL